MRKALCGLAVCVLLSPLGAARSTRLNEPLDGGIRWSSIELSADSRYLVYTGYQRAGEPEGTYLVSVEGGAVRNLAAGLDAALVASPPVVAPQCDRVLFIATALSGPSSYVAYDIYAVPLAGGAVRVISDPLVADGIVRSFAVSPDSTMVIYHADQSTFGRFEFFSTHLAETPFRRGDANDDGALDIADAVATLTHLFEGSVDLPCRDAADTNDDGGLNIADPIRILSHLFAGTGPLPAPFDACGRDPTEEPLGCRGYRGCP